MTIKERILQIAKEKGVTNQKICNKVGLTYGNFTGENKKRPINSDAIANLLSEYPDINPIWLLTGKGEMIKSANDKSTNQTITGSYNMQAGKEINNNQRRDNPDIEKEVVELKEQLKKKDETIEKLIIQIEKLITKLTD